MDYLSIKTAYLEGQLTDTEAHIQLDSHFDADSLAGYIITLWGQLLGLRLELEKTRELKGRSRLTMAQVSELIDLALMNKDLEPEEAISYHVDEGMLEDVAKYHVETYVHMMERHTERAKYLENPETAPRYCTRCGKQVTARDLSTRCICHECGMAASTGAIYGMMEKSGPYYDRYVEGMLRYLQRLAREEIAKRDPETIDPRSADADDRDEQDDDTPAAPKYWICPRCGNNNVRENVWCTDCAHEQPPF